jgi:uncharacterized OB-fold protein/acyl dehydratase
MTTEHDAAAFYASLQKYVGMEIGVEQVAPDPVNTPMVRHWVEAMGDTNPVYTDEAAAKASVHGGLVAPPSMLQAWVMRPYGVARDAGGPTPYTEMTEAIESGGFTSVVASNCEQVYDRYLRPGDVLTMKTTIDSISEQKATALGQGHYVTTRQDYFDQNGERVGSMLFRILKFRPGTGRSPAAAKPAATTRPPRPRPATTHDDAFFWEGLKEGKLLIQKCADCGTLRHPPGPMCRNCRSLRWTTVESSGKGTLHSFVVVHYPQVPSFDYPNQVVLIELDEGIRLVANAVAGTPREALVIGSPVELQIEAVDDDLSLPFFRILEDTVTA